MKLLILTFFTFYFAVGGLLFPPVAHLFAQPPVTQEWVARYPGGPSNDLYGPFLAVDKQGNSYMAGTHVINDSINILCVKYNTSGVQQWATLYKYPGEGYFTPSGLALDTFGNAYVTSSYGQSPLLPPNSLLVKFGGSNGSVLWAKRYVGEYLLSEPFDIKIDRLNNIYVVGASDTSHLVIKYNTNGDSIWVRKYHPPGARDLAYACTIDDSLNVILTGRRRYCTAICFDTVLTAKYNPNGILRWMRTYRYDNVLNYGKKIVADQYGSVYIGGQSRISGFLVYLTLKYDRNGVQQWASIYNGPGWDDYIQAIAIDRPRNSVCVTGGSSISASLGYYITIKYNIGSGDSIWVRSYGMVDFLSGARDIKIDTLGNSYVTGASGPYNSTQDVVTIKYSPQGNQVWLVSYNGPFNGGDGARALELDKQNNVYVLGYSQSAYQVSDYVVIKYSQFSGVQPVSNEMPGVFKLGQNYPNPFNTSSKFKVQSPRSASVKVPIFDVLGREVGVLVNEELKPGTYEVAFDGSNYASGVYFYQLIADGNIIDTKKFIVVK